MASQYSWDAYQNDLAPASSAEASEKMAFLRRTYATLGLAILAFVGLMAFLLNNAAVMTFLENNLRGAGRGAWLGVIVLFIAGNFAAHYMAQPTMSRGTQWMGLGLCVVLWSIMFLPIMYIATTFYPNAQIPLKAGLLTGIVFGGLTLSVFISGKDFSFMRTALMVGSFLALGMIVIALIAGIDLGLWFIFAMVALACGYIIYDTSEIMHRYPLSGHVGAAVALFSDFALLLWYIIRIFLYSNNE